MLVTWVPRRSICAGLSVRPPAHPSTLRCTARTVTLHDSRLHLQQVAKPEEHHPERSEQSRPAEEQHKWEKPGNKRPIDWRRVILYTYVAGCGLGIGTFIRKRFLNDDAQKHDPNKFVTAELLSKEPVSSTASIFTLSLKHDAGKSQKDSSLLEACKEACKQGIWNVEFKQPQIQIVRAYTALPPYQRDSEEDGQILRFLIRKDARGGEMSSYLHRLPAGAPIELRGPNIEYVVPKTTKNVVFVAGGTGIAPALQVAYAMFAGRNREELKDKRLHILWGNRKREDCAGAESARSQSAPKAVEAGISSWGWNIFCPRSTSVPQEGSETEPNAIVQQLKGLQEQYAGHVSVDYFVDEEKAYITAKTLQDALSLIRTQGNSLDGTHVIVSGPPGFITYIAGPKAWQDGEEKQGLLGGRLAQVLGRDSKIRVWKV